MQFVIFKSFVSKKIKIKIKKNVLFQQIKDNECLLLILKLSVHQFTNVLELALCEAVPGIQEKPSFIAIDNSHVCMLYNYKNLRKPVEIELDKEKNLREHFWPSINGDNSEKLPEQKGEKGWDDKGQT